MKVKLYSDEEYERTKIIAEVLPFDDPFHSIVVRFGMIDMEGSITLTEQSAPLFLAGISKALELASTPRK